MKNRLFLSIFLAALAGGAVLAGCSKNSKTDVAVGGADTSQNPPVLIWNFNKGNHLVPSIQFAQPSPNGTLAWLGFQNIGPDIPCTVTDSAYVTAGGAGGFRMLLGWPKSTNDTNYDDSAINPNVGTLGLAQGKAMLIPQYKVGPGPNSPWIPYDSVTLIANGTPVSDSTVLYPVMSSPNANFQVNFKSKDGSQGASVVIVVASTAKLPVLPPR